MPSEGWDAKNVFQIVPHEERAFRSPENVKKFEYSRNHFARLNEWLSQKGIGVTYQLNFLAPRSFNTFLQLLRDSQIEEFRPELDVIPAKLARDAE